jgi:hypothetical protein
MVSYHLRRLGGRPVTRLDQQHDGGFRVNRIPSKTAKGWQDCWGDAPLHIPDEAGEMHNKSKVRGQGDVVVCRGKTAAVARCIIWFLVLIFNGVDR